MKVLTIGGNRFLRSVIALLPVQVVFATRKQGIAVFLSEKPNRVIIPGSWREIIGAGFSGRTSRSINLCRRIKTLSGGKVKILRCGYEDSGEEKDFVQIPCLQDELRKKLRI